MSLEIENIRRLTSAAVCFAACLSLVRGAEDEAAMFADLVRAPEGGKVLRLAARGEPAIPHLIDGLRKRGRVSALCAWALWHHPNPAAASELRTLLLQSDQVAGYWAAKALGRMPDPENIKALSALLPDEPLGFWELSSGGKPRVAETWENGRRYTSIAKPDMPNLRVAYAAMEALGELGGAEAAAVLMRALTNDQYLIRAGAVRGLGAMRYRGAEPELRALEKNDPVLLVRVSAKRALRQIHDEIEPATDLPVLPPAIAFIKTKLRSDANLGFRDSYFFPKTPRYHSGENLYTLTPPRPDGALRNLTQLENGEVQGPEVSFDGRRILFAMRRNSKTDGFHIFEINVDGSGLRQLTFGNCNDADPCYLPDGRIAFCSDRAGYQEYYHQERSRVLYVMDVNGDAIRQITFNPNQDYEPLVLGDGRLLYGSYRFYAQDGHSGPLRGEHLGLSRIETVLRTALPDGSRDDLFYGSMRGSFYSPLRPMPFGDQFAGWHPRGNHVGVSISQAREMPDGSLICISPAGLTSIDLDTIPLDCEIPIYPEVVNLAGGEEVYIHNYDEMNPVGRYTTPHPASVDWIWVSHAPWHDVRGNAYGIFLMNLKTRGLQLVFDDPAMSDVDPIPIVPHPAPPIRPSQLAEARAKTGYIYCNSVFNSDVPFDRRAAKYVRILEGLQMGQSINANAAFRTRVLGTAPLHPDGSFYVEVPADTPLRFELLDEDGEMLVHETEFNYIRPGERKGCIGCHEKKGYAGPVQRPLALEHSPSAALRQRGDLIYFGRPSRPYNTVYRE